MGAKKQGKKGKQKTKKMVSVFVKNVCGCCEGELKFASIEAANEAFGKAGLTVSATITDDAGVTHTGIDTFYGFTTAEGEAKDRGLDYLIGQLRAAR